MLSWQKRKVTLMQKILLLEDDAALGKGIVLALQGYWFYRYHYTIAPVLLMIPIFLLLGWAIPSVMYRLAAKHSVVERLREAES